MINQMKLSFKIANGKAEPIFNFEKLELSSFSKPKAGQLQGFIAARISKNVLDLRIFFSEMPKKNGQSKERQKMLC